MNSPTPITHLHPKPLIWLVSLLLLAYPATALVIKNGHSTTFYLLTLIGLGWATFRQNRPQPLLDEKRLFFAVSLFFIVGLLTYLLGNWNEAGFKTLGKFLNLLLVIPLYFLLKKLQIRQGLFWYGLVLGATVAAGMAIYELIHATGALDQRRAHGITHPILFGDLSLSMGMMALAGIGYFRAQNRWLIALPIFAGLAGLTASFLSAARGGWIAIPFLLLLLAWQARKSLKLWHFGAALSVLIVLPMAAYFSPNSAVKVKVDSAAYNLTHYGNSPITAPVRGTSVGTRLEMWQASWTIFKEQPWIGVSWGRYQEYAQKLVDAGERHPSASRWNNPHSQYVSSAVNAGVVGLSALLLLLLIPLLLFLRSLKSASLESRRLALAGAVLIIAYAGFAVSESIFQRSLPTTFFAFYLALIGALLIQQKTKANNANPSSPRKSTLSVMVISKNEADRIEACLQSVSGLADEIIVLDSGSSDNTVEIAKKFTDNVFVTDWPGYGRQKQRALEKASSDWVLSIDADERVTPDLRGEIEAILAQEADAVGYRGYRIPMATVVFGKRLDYGVTGRSPMRLFRREGTRYKERLVHEGVQFEGEKSQLSGTLLHLTFRDFYHALEKNNQYAWLWAQQRQTEKRHAGLLSAFLHSIWSFFSIMLFRLGFLDGRRGFMMAVLYSHYTFNKYTALWSLRVQAKQSSSTD